MSIKRPAFIFAICAAALAPLLQGIPAHAQGATRTFVSGGGNDANPCTRTQPCRTFVGALQPNRTAKGGTITCLDTASYGRATITQPVTIDCTGALGRVAAQAANGITINVLPDILNPGVVSLRGLVIDGVGGNGLIGISILNATTVHIEQCKIYGFKTAGIAFAPTQATASPTVIINDTHVYNNNVGISMNGSGAPGDMEMRDVLVDLNSGDAIQITTAANHVGVLIERITLAFNGGTGLNISSTGTPGALVYVGDSTIVGNAVGVANSGAGTFQSFKNNQIAGNSTDGTPITAFPGPGGTPLQ